MHGPETEPRSVSGRKILTQVKRIQTVATSAPDPPMFPLPPSPHDPADRPAAAWDPVMVASSRGAYPVFVGTGLLARLGSLLREPTLPVRLGTRCAVVTDSRVAPLYAETALAGLRAGGFDPALLVVPAGESSKSLREVERLCEGFGEAGLDRQGFVVALGGGVVGDLAGFAAGVFQRGVPCVQVPTTVTAQVDSAIGGKTGVNTVRAKNQVGVFHPPVAVVADVETLRTLPTRELAEGCAEAIKHAAICDRGLFDKLFAPGAGSPPERLRDAAVIRRNVEIKAGIVGADEFERTGERALLNFGHTVGHGIESVAGYGRYLHGEAVSLGMVAAGRISVDRAGLPTEDLARLVATLQAFGLPTHLDEALPTAALLASLRLDKKFGAGRSIRFVLLSRLGAARLSEPGEVTWEDLQRAVDSLRRPVAAGAV